MIFLDFILYGFGFGLGFRKFYGYGFGLGFEFIWIWIWTLDMDLETFGLEHGFGSAFVNFHQIPSIIGTFCRIIISFNLKNGFGFHLDLDLDLLKIIHGLGL